MALQTIRRMFRRKAARHTSSPVPSAPAAAIEVAQPDRPDRSNDSEVFAELAVRDLWFYEHFIKVPNILADFLGRLIPLESAVVLDFGCGEGLMAKGLARFTREVHGVDVVPDFLKLEERFVRVFGPDNPFPPVTLKLVRPGEPLPYEDKAFDAVFAWSVFEHVADVPFAFGEIRRVLRPGGALFLQIAPLYYSPHGGHLRNLIEEPWIHLKLAREELIDRIRLAQIAGVPPEARDEAFNAKSDAEFREYIVAGLDSLNRITVRELAQHARDAGFQIQSEQTWQDCPYEVPPELLALHPREDLMTDQVVLLMSR